MTEYFQELFKASEIEWHEIIECNEPSISTEQNLELFKPISEEEVKDALFQMHPDKSPDPDGMTPTFYQKFWRIYYPRGSYRDAVLGTNPSFIWWSIWEAQDLVRKGVRRSVRSGSEIDIIKDPWLHSDEDMYVVSNHPSLGNKKVASLLKIGQRDWDAELINDMFVESDKELILGIPLSSSADKDLWQWTKELSCFYTVKSAYKFTPELKGRWWVDDNSSFWHQFWQLKVSPKAVFEANSKEKRGVAGMLCWALWKGRNDLVWNQNIFSIEEVVVLAKSNLDQWLSAQEKHASLFVDLLLPEDGGECWTKPQMGYAKINVDATLFVNDRQIGFSCVARDHDGYLIEAIASRRRGIVKPEMAEALGVKEALS
ncbi:uncharacterized protein LOC133806561 [Humulus lupulus]|uniref:uncharacterized protein LOC133806561 n=1 Tax=Humulus lupulus TaxID=3486 RepID=UPI002B417842|nr:uncharacterized protein LOC133806561 [Humulus lupulus]